MRDSDIDTLSADGGQNTVRLTAGSLAYLLKPCAICPHDYGDHGEPTLTDQSCGECNCERFVP